MSDKVGINQVAHFGDDGAFCEKWARHFGVTIDVRDCGTHVQIFFGAPGEKPGPFHADEETLQEFHNDAQALLARRTQSVGYAANFTAHLARGLAVDSPEWRVASHMHRAFVARYSGGDMHQGLV